MPDFDFIGPVVDILPDRGQTIAGFGGAFTESSALVFKELSQELKQEVLQGYFGASGIGLTLGRVHINSCDFSRSHYSFDDHDGDLELKHFDRNASHDAEALIPFIQAAQDVIEAQGKSLQLLATPWSPPAWMKTSRQMDHSGRPCLRSGVQETWAKYIARWIDAYNLHGIQIWAVTVQNEPENNAVWEGCVMTPQEEADFLGDHLGPVLESTHPSVLIFVHDHNKDHVYDRASAMLGRAKASKYADGVAFHWYTGDGFEAVKQVQQDFPKALMLASEATYEKHRWKKGASLVTGYWSFGEGYAHDIIGDLNAGSIGWIDWNLLLDEQGGPNHANNSCDAAMMANLTAQKLYRHPQYYYLGHFSKFIPKDSKLLKTTVGPTLSYRGSQRPYGTCTAADGLQATSALRPDNAVATVVLNCGDDTIKFKLREGSRAARAAIPPHSIQTYVFEHRGRSPVRTRSEVGGSTGAPFIGVNLGGWLLLEDWMWAVEMRLKGIPDEYTLVQRNGGPLDPRAISLIQGHRETFVTERDLNRLQDFGVSHVRVPIGYWLVDYDPADGFVDGAERYLYRLLCWLQKRGMRAVIDLHALPGAQTGGQSFTGRKTQQAHFFLDKRQYERGKRAMMRLAELILQYEADPRTAGVVMGLELVNEPQWTYWNSTNGIKELYETMVPQVRRLLPAKRYLLLLNFMEAPRWEGAQWLASMLAKDPVNFEGVVYDAHIYHAFGDDDKKPGPAYSATPGGMDACKTCCRDALVLAPMVQKQVPMIIGEYSLNTGFPGNYDFYFDFIRNQLSLWANTPFMVGTFFWNHRVLREGPTGWFVEMSLLELIGPEGPLPSISQVDISRLCPTEDLSRCPQYDLASVRWTSNCAWAPKKDRKQSHRGADDRHADAAPSRA